MSWKLGASKSTFSGHLAVKSHSPPLLSTTLVLFRSPVPLSHLSHQRSKISKTMPSTLDPLPRYRLGQPPPSLLVPRNNMLISAPGCSLFASSPVRPLPITAPTSTDGNDRSRSLPCARCAGPRGDSESTRIIPPSTETACQQPREPPTKAQLVAPIHRPRIRQQPSPRRRHGRRSR